QTFSIKNHLSGNIHIDLIRVQSEFGARHSYRQSAKDIKSLTGNERKINNKSRIHRITNQVGKILANKTSFLPEKEIFTSPSEPAKQLCAAIDGGHVHDANNKGHNFEAMIAKVYKPGNVIRTDQYHSQIIRKHCAGSAKDDAQETMKKNVIE